MCPPAVMMFKQVINGVSNFADMKDCVVSYRSYIAQKLENMSWKLNLLPW